MIFKMFKFNFFIFIFLAIFGNFLICSALKRLKRYNIDPKGITVSGISSGGAMAIQYHFAHSRDISGAGSFAGGPFLCGLHGLVAMCIFTPSLVNIKSLISEADYFSSIDLIDDVSNINGSRVYIFHGTRDTMNMQGTGKLIAEMYKHYCAEIHTEFSIECEHGQPTHNIGGPCDKVNFDHNFLNNCGYNGAFEALNFLYGGNLIKPDRSDLTFRLSSKVEEFDQTEFFKEGFPPELISMDKIGFIYVPEKCKRGECQCKLHIAFHGCSASRLNIGDAYATKSGYIDVADLNDIIVLFPQAIPSLIPPNPIGCWDWFLYTGPLYPTKHGYQIEKVYSMQKRLTG